MANQKQDPIPAYRKHKGTGQGYVVLNGKRTYLGRYGPEGKARYDRTISEWLARGRRPAVDASDITVIEIAAAYMNHCNTAYSGSGEYGQIKRAVSVVQRLFGEVEAARFGPAALQACREDYVRGGLVRKSVNDHVVRLKRMFRWACETERIPATVYHGLMCVSGLRRGRTEAPEGKKRGPVSDDAIDATVQNMNRHLAAVVCLLRLTGARPSEILCMRRCDIDQRGSIWFYRPQAHKLQFHELDRLIQLGPQAQRILLPFLGCYHKAYLFSPAEAERERRAEMTKQRKTPRGYGNGPGTNRKSNPKRAPGNKYDRTVLRKAVATACKAAGVPHWTPYQIRHTFATAIRREYGIDVARALCGHKSIVMTESYAEIDMARTADVVAKVG